MGLSQALDAVKQFHVTFGHPVATFPKRQTLKRAADRAKWLIEEARELRDARTLEAQADAYIDSIYFALGGFVELGLDPQPLWDIVHQANLAKVWPDGSVQKRDGDGKTVKPPGWVDPQESLRAEIARQITLHEGVTS